MQRQSRHNRLVLNTPDQASCDVFRPCPPGWAPFICPPQIDWMSDQPVQFAFTAGTFEQDGFSMIGYSNGQTESPPIGSSVGPSPSGGLDVVDVTAGGNAQALAAVSGSGQPPLWARPAHVSVSGAAGSIELQAPIYEAAYDQWTMLPPYNPDDPTPPLGLVAGQNYCVTITFDTPLLQPDPSSDLPVVFGFVCEDIGGLNGIDTAAGGVLFPPGVTEGVVAQVSSQPDNIYAHLLNIAGQGWDGGGQLSVYDSNGAFIMSFPVQYSDWMEGSVWGELSGVDALTLGQTYYVKITKP